MIISASFDINNPELWVNRGLAYGDGLFETMRFESDCIPLIDFHLQRLNHGLKQLKLNCFDPEGLLAALTEYTNKAQTISSVKSTVMKLVVFRAIQSRTYRPLTTKIDWLLTVDDLPVIDTNQPLKLGVAAAKLSTQPLLAGLKHLSRVEQVMLADELNGFDGFEDLLLISDKNQVIETTHQNIVLIKKNRLFTPKLNQSGVSGVALAWLKTLFQVNELVLKLESLSEYDCMLVCNSIRGFRLVESIQKNNNESISFGTSHPIHDKINALWKPMFVS